MAHPGKTRRSCTPSSNLLAKLEAIVAPGLTLHGLRVSFAAALGDRDTRMGAHYTRHVEQENKIIYLFASKTMGTGTERDLENERAPVFQSGRKTSR